MHHEFHIDFLNNLVDIHIESTISVDVESSSIHARIFFDMHHEFHIVSLKPGGHTQRNPPLSRMQLP